MTLILGTAATQDSSAFATAAQGAKADTAIQDIVPGTGVVIDSTDPTKPIVSVSGAGTGSVTNVSVTPANGFLGSVATPTTTPAISIQTSVTGILKGNGTGVSAAVAGDFPTLNQNTTGRSGSTTSIASIAALRLLSIASAVDGQIITLAGYYAEGDGGGGDFFWNATSTTADNGGTIIAPTGVATGRWYRIYTGAVAVRWFGAKGDGVTDDTTAILAAIAAAENIIFSAGNYLISASLSLSDSQHVYFLGGAALLAGANSLTMWDITTHAYGAQFWNVRCDGNGFTGVTAFDLTNVRIQAALMYPYMLNMTNGIILRSGCFGIQITEPNTYNGVPNPLQIISNCGEVMVLNPNFNNETGTGAGTGIGINIQAGVTPNEGIQVIGGYVQGFVTGVKDSALGTKIDGTYFEQNSAEDILFSSSTGGSAYNTQHWSMTAGTSYAVSATSSDGILVFNPLMGSGVRTGLLNFDNTNTNCLFYVNTSASSKNTPLGIVTGITDLGGTQHIAWTATDNSGASPALTFTVNTPGYYLVSGRMATFFFDVTYPTTTDTNLAKISAPLTAFSLYGAVVINTTYGSTLTYSAGVFRNGAGAVLENVNLSGKRVTVCCTYMI